MPLAQGGRLVLGLCRRALGRGFPTRGGGSLITHPHPPPALCIPPKYVSHCPFPVSPPPASPAVTHTRHTQIALNPSVTPGMGGGGGGDPPIQPPQVNSFSPSPSSWTCLGAGGPPPPPSAPTAPGAAEKLGGGVGFGAVTCGNGNRVCHPQPGSLPAPLPSLPPPPRRLWKGG